MLRYLSPAWFARLGEIEAGAGSGAGNHDRGVVLRQVVTGTPEGAEVRYDVIVADGRGRLRPTGTAPPHVTVTTDYATAAAIAAGHLSTNAALAEGRLKVAGDMSALADAVPGVAGVDPLPPELRAETEFP